MAKVIIFSGAGVSAQSGLATFRAEDGLWSNHRIEDVCMAGCMQYNKEMTVDFYDELRTSLETKQPNAAHKKIAAFKEKYTESVAVITQNVDDLFERAGCLDVMHLHGFLPEIYCENCGYIENIGYAKQYDARVFCPTCHENAMRPNIVFFAEQAPKYQDFYREFDDCEVFVVIGTSGNVINTDMFLNPDIKFSILNNLEPSDAIDAELYTLALFKPATEAIEEILHRIEEYMKK